MSGPLYFDRVMETSAITGTGPYTLTGAVLGYQPFSVVGDGNTAYYCAMAVDGSGTPSGDWEMGLGTYTLSGTILARTTILASSNASAAVNWSSGTKRVMLAQPSAAIGGLGGGLLGLRIITATGAGTYTPTPGTTSIVLELVGGGGGGAGADGTSGNNAVGHSGGGGGWLHKRLTGNFSGASFSVGAKGTGGISTNGAGNNGGNTTFTETGGTIYTASGGAGGTTGGPSTNFVRASVAGMGAGGGTTNGDELSTNGGSAETSMTLATYCTSGRGGASKYSPGGLSSVLASAADTNFAGVAATGKGGGGGGACCNGIAAAVAGGNGSDGMIVIWEYATPAAELTTQFIRKAADQIVNNSTTLVADNTLIIPVGANEVWEFEFQVPFTTTQTADFRCGLKYPTSPTEISYSIIGPAINAGTDTSGGVTGDFATSHGIADVGTGGIRGGDTNKGVCVLRGFLRNGANAGNIVLWWAQGTATAVDTIVKAGAWALGRRITGGLTRVVPGAEVLLAEQTITNGMASLDFITRNVSGQAGALFQTDFDLYRVELELVSPVVDAHIAWRLSSDGGSSWISANYFYAAQWLTNAPATGTYNDSSVSSTYGIVQDSVESSQADGLRGVVGDLQIWRPARVELHRFSAYSSTWAATGTLNNVRSHGWLNNAVACNAIRFFASTGNLQSGRIRIYGK